MELAQESKRQIDLIADDALNQFKKVAEAAQSALRTAERVNDFASPGDVNLVCGLRVRWSVFSPQVVG